MYISLKKMNRLETQAAYNIAWHYGGGRNARAQRQQEISYGSSLTL